MDSTANVEINVDYKKEIKKLESLRINSDNEFNSIIDDIIKECKILDKISNDLKTNKDNNFDQFEYKYEIGNQFIGTHVEYWNTMGNQGWEMVHYEPPREGGCIIWKRKIVK
jgi:hypothetical protein